MVLYPAAHLEEIVGAERKWRASGFAWRGRAVSPLAGVFIYLQGNAPVTDFLEGQLPLEEGAVCW